MARRRRSRSRSRRAVFGRRARRTYRRGHRALASVSRRTHKLFGGLPRWAKPSNVAAVIGVTVGVGDLVLTPLSNGDSWQQRLIRGFTTYKSTNNAMDILAYDGANGAPEIFVAQLKQNAPGAIIEIAGFGVAAGILKRLGM